MRCFCAVGSWCGVWVLRKAESCGPQKGVSVFVMRSIRTVKVLRAVVRVVECNQTNLHVDVIFWSVRSGYIW